MTFEEMLSTIEDDSLRASLLAEYNKAADREGWIPQSEVDRRINEVSHKHILDEKQMEAKIRQQIEEEARLTAEQKAEKIKSQAEEILKAARMKENRFNAMSQCIEAGIDKDTIDSMLDFFITDDIDITNQNVEKFIKSHTAMQNAIRKDMMKQTPDPQEGDKSKSVTKEDFDNMSMSDQIAFREAHPELASQFMGK